MRVTRRRGSAAGLAASLAALAVAPLVSVAVSPLIARAQQPGAVLVAPVAGTITPVISSHLQDGVRQAERDGAVAFVVELDTPGGLDTSMREIIQAFLTARVPVVVYVSPQGARAASAGALITMAAHIAAMAPGTAIGASTPVDLQGGDISDKIINDAAAYAESIAEARSRNVEFAIDTVREGRSVPAEEALRIGAVDLLAPSRAELLRAIDGRTVRLASGAEVALETRRAPVERYDLRGFRAILQWLADPNLAFLFLSIGTLGIIYELANPGVGAGGIAGVIMIMLAMFSLSVLPVNAVGALLLLLALALLIAEVFSPGVGVFAAGGTVALLLGGIFLFRGSVGVDLGVLIPFAIVVGGGAVWFTRLAWRTRGMPSPTGPGSVMGESTEVRRASNGIAEVFVGGSWWRARLADGDPSGDLEEGARVRVVGIDGLDLIVKRADEVAGQTEQRIEGEKT